MSITVEKRNYEEVKMKRNISIAVLIVTIIIAFSIEGQVKKNTIYNSAKKHIEKGQWNEANSELEAIQGYKDTDKMMKKNKYHYYLQLGDTALKNKDFSLALNHYQSAQETSFNDSEINQKITIVRKILAAKQQKIQSEYKITEYQLSMSKDNWKYVLIQNGVKQDELIKVAKDLHSHYPNNCFKLFSSLKFLKLMYKYDLTNSYITNQFDYSDKDYDQYNRGIINKMAGVWTYTTQNYESVKL